MIQFKVGDLVKIKTKLLDSYIKEVCGEQTIISINGKEVSTTLTVPYSGWIQMKDLEFAESIIDILNRPC